jgi:hypothetical protein
VHLQRGPVLPDELEKVEHGFAERMRCALMLNEGVQTADTFLQSPLKVHQQPVRYREQCVGVSRPKQTVKNVRQAVVVHQVAEDAESEAIVVIIWFVQHSSLVRALNVEENESKAPGIRKFGWWLVKKDKGLMQKLTRSNKE